MGYILKHIMHESFVHVSLYTGVFFIFVHFWLGVLWSVFLLIGSLLIVQMSITPYVSFTDGASCSTRNLSSKTKVIYDPDGELIDMEKCMDKRQIQDSTVINKLIGSIPQNTFNNVGPMPCGLKFSYPQLIMSCRTGGRGLLP